MLHGFHFPMQAQVVFTRFLQEKARKAISHWKGEPIDYITRD